MLRRLLLSALAAAVLLAATPASAPADGDPASHVLLAQDAFYPYSPKVPENVKRALDELLVRTRKAGFPLKVAIVATKNDLGSVSQFYGRPAEYATYLGREISFNSRKQLLVVMPAGYGTSSVPEATATEGLEGLDPPDADSGDALGRAAISATLELAKAAGHPVAAPKLPPPSDDGGGTSPLVIFGVPVLLLALGGGLAALKRRDSERTAGTAGTGASG